ncbi:MAG: TonB-dependent receptor [Sphingopyxis sp.]
MICYKHGIRVLALASVAASALAATPALAQDSAETTASDNGGDLVVTARRREENLLDVPIAITAYSGEQLEATGALDITDIGDTTPNVTLENSRATNSTLTAFIRGVGQQDPVAGFEAGVGIYLDDVYLNRPQAAVLDIYDVERIEVLRGPQGTLYGRNTIGGAVKYVTRRLSRDLSVRGRLTYGTDDMAEGTLSLSAPISDLVRVGGGIARLSRGGFGTNTNLGIDNYIKDVWAGRLSLEMGGYGEPVLIRITGDYTRDRSNPRGGHRLVPGLLSGAPVLGDVYDTRGGLNSPRQDVEAYGLAANVSVDLSDSLQLRSISSWRHDFSSAPIDFDALPSVDVDVPSLNRNDQISQEFQLAYSGDRLNGLVGFYYLNAKAITQFDVILATTGTLLNLPGLNAFTAGNVRTSTWSAFGDFTFDVTDSIAISLGGRYTQDRRRSTILRQTKIGGASPQFGGNAIAIATVTDFTGSATFRDFTPRASLSWQPTDDHLLYASYAEGFKGGGFDPRGDARIAPDTDRNGIRSYQEIFDFFQFSPETVRSYELGYKGSFFGGDARLALTGFYGDYTDVQIPGSVGVDANGDGIFESFAGVTTNAGAATFKGVELETFARFARGFAGEGSSLSFTGTLGFIDGQYDTFIVNNVNIANLRAIQNTPRWTASGTLAANMNVGGGNLLATSTLSYRSLTHQFEVPSPFIDQPGYALLDASLVWTSPDERFTVGLHGKNLTDRHYITAGYQFISVQPNGTPNRTAAGNVIPTLGREGILSAFYGNPRQIFVSVGFHF